MGFDLMGLSPTNQIDFKDPEADFKNMSISGTYFRSNCWCWRPLWEFVINTCADIITPDDADNGHYNQGHEINKVKALKIGARLQNRIDDGFADKYITDRNKELDEAPDLECYICEGTGKRANPPIVGAGDLLCNGCNATGKKRPSECEYYLDKDNIQEFADFCKNSGRFSIC